jgi:hypothetical protein
MKRRFLYVTLLLVAVLSAALMTPPAAECKCGVERWPVKTASDPDAKYLFTASGALKKPRKKTIVEMLELPFPFPSPKSIPKKYYTERVRPQETSIVTIEATLTAYKREPDEDYHLVIEDDDGNTMVAEIVNLPCVKSKNKIIRDMIAKARADFDEKFNATGKYKETNTKVTITGVPFFDRPHGAKGGADNGIEIHPVLKIEF